MGGACLDASLFPNNEEESNFWQQVASGAAGAWQQ
jgi:hypothetical protein